jgi:hypothetical protein
VLPVGDLLLRQTVHNVQFVALFRHQQEEGTSQATAPSGFLEDQSLKYWEVEEIYRILKP